MGRTVIAYGACILLLSACGGAIAERADRNNPAHCLAAYNYAHLIYRRGPNPNKAAALDIGARTAFESLKLDKNGNYPVALSEAGEFAREHRTEREPVRDAQPTPHRPVNRQPPFRPVACSRERPDVAG